MIEIKHRHTDKALLTISRRNLRGADLADADLRGADLAGADLRGANLKGAMLAGANLRDSILADAVLACANLANADLRGADLRDATITGVDLRCADMTDAIFKRADLRKSALANARITGADFTDAVFAGATIEVADLAPIRSDVFEVLSASPNEAKGLRLAIIDGRIDGSAYEGICACLVGTLASLRRHEPVAIPGLAHDPNRPAERFFLAIAEGDTPRTNPVSAIVLKWVNEFIAMQSLTATSAVTAPAG